MIELDFDAIGPLVGQAWPDFELPDQFGRTARFSDHCSAENAIVLFYRSAEW